MIKKFIQFFFISFLLLSSSNLLAASNDEYKKNHEKMMKKHGHGHGKYGHDEVNMPGLQGKDTTDIEVSDLKNIFQNHKEIKRTVTNIPNGIKTETYSDKIETEIELTDTGISVLQTSEDPKVVELLQKHAAEINDMVERGMRAVHERMMSSKKTN
jgi:hypothetical protein